MSRAPKLGSWMWWPDRGAASRVPKQEGLGPESGDQPCPQCDLLSCFTWDSRLLVLNWGELLILLRGRIP